MLRLRVGTLSGPQVAVESPIEQFEQHLEADTCQCWIISTLGELVADESMLCPSWLVEAEHHTCVTQCLADEVAARWRDMSVFLAEDLRAVSSLNVKDTKTVGKGERTIISSPVISLTLSRL